MRFADLDTVTLDAYGTLVRLIDPLPDLRRALGKRGVTASDERIAAAFAAEAAYYAPRASSGRDRESLGRFREECAGVFLDALGAELDVLEFAPAYVDALRFEPIPGVAQTLAQLRARGLELAVVGNWDISIHERLAELGLTPFFSVIVSSAEVGVMKPDPAIFHAALERLGVRAERALHVGDDPVDERGARAAGMQFVPAPLVTAFDGWT